MNWLTILAVAVGLAMDAFAVAVAAGLAVHPVTLRHRFRLGFHFGLFQFMMPVLGWLAGQEASPYIRQFDHWVAFGLLSAVGGKMLWEARRTREPNHSEGPRKASPIPPGEGSGMREWQSRVGEEIVSPPHRPHPNPLPAGEGTDSARFPESRSARRADPTRGWSLVTLSIATSVDALAVGFSMAALGVSVWRPSVVIGFVAGGLTLVGLSFGRRLGSRWGRRAEAAGGCVLLAIGAKILITHLSGA